MRQWVMGAMAAAVLVAMPAEAKTKHHARAHAVVDTHPQATMVVDADTGEILQASNVDATIYPASLTKMMTLYLLFDDLEAGKVRMTDRVPVSENAAEQDPSILGLTPGKSLSVEEAMLGMIVKSANDAAMATGEFLAGGDEDAFAERMTRKARELGMTRTTFKNPNGLPNSEQKTTARDMATLARALMHNHAKEYHWFSTKSFMFNGQVVNGHNHLLDHYKGADGLKTGFIAAAGFNIVTTAKRNDRHLVAVVMGWPTWQSRDRQVAKLLDAGFKRAPDNSGVQLAEAAAQPQSEESDDSADKAARAVMTAMAAPSKAKPKSANTHKREDSAAGDTDDDEEWVVQVGSFSQQTTALQKAKDALLKMGKYGEDGEAKAIVISKKGHKTTYASRIVGLSKDDAQNACRSLSKHHHPCRAINIG